MTIAEKHPGEHARVLEAYLKMANELRYRPAAPSDGMGNIHLSKEESTDHQRLREEAATYADEFIQEENTRSFRIGVADGSMQRAFVYTLEAAKQMCSGKAGRPWAAKLLEMASAELGKA